MNEALKQALEALELCNGAETVDGVVIYTDQEIAAIKEAIAEMESQEPVAWVDLQREAQQIVESKVLWKKFIDGTPLVNDISCWMVDFALQLTHPPQRTWVGLTDDEHCDIWYKESLDWMEYGKAIEAKLKQKNGFAEEKNT
jgi:hypothetical protein